MRESERKRKRERERERREGERGREMGARHTYILSEKMGYFPLHKSTEATGW